MDKIGRVIPGPLQQLHRRHQQSVRAKMTVISVDAYNPDEETTITDTYDVDGNVMGDTLPPLRDSVVIDAFPPASRTSGPNSVWQRSPKILSHQEGKTMSPPPPADNECIHCHGAGYVRVDVPYGDPLFGKAVMCACKVKQTEEKKLQHLQTFSGIDTLSRFQKESFDSFDMLQPGVGNAFRSAMRIAGQRKGWLVLLGPNGCGKTHLAISIAKELLGNGHPVLFFVVADLLDHLRAAFAPTAVVPYDELFLQIRDIETLILDDLGAENGTEWAQEKLFQLLNYRYNAELPTVITTNQTRLEGIEARLRSRLMDRELVKMEVMTQVQDYRPIRPVPELEDDEDA